MGAFGNHNLHHGVILKHSNTSQSLYDAMDPDKDTLMTHQLGRKQLLDTEHRLLLHVERLLDKANYFQVRGLFSASPAMYGQLAGGEHLHYFQ